MSVVSADGHFDIPEGTITIVGRLPWEREGEDSWEEWGVDKTPVKTVTIGQSAFNGCSSLVTVTIRVTFIGHGAFYDWWPTRRRIKWKCTAS